MVHGTPGAAKEKSLASLHTELATKLADLIRNGKDVTVGGETRKVPVGAATLNVARAFLKDNDISCDPDNPRAVGDLAEAIDEFTHAEDGELPKFTN